MKDIDRTAAIAARLRATLPPSLHDHVPDLAKLLATIIDGRLSPENAQEQLANAALLPLLAALGGQQLSSGTTLLTFGHNNDQRGATITIGDIAGGNIVKTQTLTLSLTLPPLSSPKALHQLRAPVADFIGRSDEIAQLVHTLTQASSQGTVSAISGIRGLGGIGKTELAYTVAHRVQSLFPDAQLVVELHGATDTPLSPTLALQNVIRAFEPSTPPSSDITHLQALYRSLLHNKRVLILADDAHDAEQIRLLQPPTGCALLVTSRQRLNLPGMYILDLWTISPHEARQLILSICPRIGISAEQLAELCGYLPLALRVSASMLANDVSLNVHQYIGELADERQRLSHLRDPDDSSLNVEASLNLSYNKLSHNLQEALCQCSVFRGNFDSKALNAVIDLPQEQSEQHIIASPSITECIRALHRRSLMEWDSQIERYHLHDLVRVFGTARLQDEPSVSLRHARYYLQVARLTDSLYTQGVTSIRQGLDLFDREQANIAAGWSWTLKQEDVTVPEIEEVMRGYASTLIITSSLRYTIQRSHLLQIEAGLTSARRRRDRTAEARLLNNLGSAHQAIGELSDALTCYERALSLARQEGSNVDEGGALRNLGRIHVDLGDPKKAITFYEQALTLARHMNDRRSEGSTLSALGFAYCRNDEAARSLPLCKQSLQIMQELGNKFGQASALNTIGNALSNLNHYQQAITSYNQARDLWAEIEDRSNEGIAISNIANCYSDLKDWVTAVRFYENALSISRSTGDWTRECELLAELGDIYIKAGDARQSTSSYKMSLKIVQELGNKRLESKILEQAGGTFESLKRYKESLSFYKRAISLKNQIEDKRGEARIALFIGYLYTKVKDLNKAFEYFTISKTIAQTLQDKQQEEYALQGIISIYRSKEQHYDEICILKQILVLNQETQNQEHEADTLDDLGWAYYHLNSRHSAIEHFEKSLAISTSIDDKEVQVSSLRGLGCCSSEMLDRDQAFHYFKEALLIAQTHQLKYAEALVLGSLAKHHERDLSDILPIQRYQQQLEIWHELDNKANIAITNWNLAIKLEQLGNIGAAYQHMQECIKYKLEMSDSSAISAQDYLNRLEQKRETAEKSHRKGLLSRIFSKS